MESVPHERVFDLHSFGHTETKPYRSALPSLVSTDTSELLFNSFYFDTAFHISKNITFLKCQNPSPHRTVTYHSKLHKSRKRYMKMLSGHRKHTRWKLRDGGLIPKGSVEGAEFRTHSIPALSFQPYSESKNNLKALRQFKK